MKGIEQANKKSDRRLMKYRGTKCLNCYHSLDISDKFCPNCSQLNSTKKLTFDDFFNEFFAGIFAYDSRFYRTIGALLFKPGKISRDYIEGKRVRYANPYRFYLSASIIFFILWGLSTDMDDVKVGNSPSEEAAARAELAEVDSILTADNVPSIPAESIIPAEDSLKNIYVPQTHLDTMNFWNATGEKLKIFYQHHKETELRDPVASIEELDYNHTTYNHWLYKKTVDFQSFISNPGLFFNYFVSKLPFIIFFYLPIFALFIWLLYLRRPFTYMEHLIFTFHNQTTLFILFGIALLIDGIFKSDTFTWLAAFIFLFYLYKAMRRFYKQGRVKTIVKYILINIIFFILAVIATVFSFLVSFAIY